MAGRNAAASQAALLLTLQIWESLINGKYMKEARQYDTLTCPTCNAHRACNNHFCLKCKTDGLCPIVFRSGHEHENHPYLQVRHYSRQYSVFTKDLERFISKEGLKHIQANKLNAGQRHFNLRSKGVAAASSSSSTRAKARDKGCEGCMASIRGSKDSKETFLVCSLQCLVKVAHERSAMDLLEMNDGVMAYMDSPLSYLEKQLPRRRMLETPAKTRINEALSLPQATGDLPMLETHEDLSVAPIFGDLPFLLAFEDYPMFGTLAEIPTDEILPFPLATEDFSLPFETQEDLSVASILKELPFPLATEDYLMFGTPAEASIGEFPSFPPATKAFSMFEKPAAAPAETPKLETFSLPLKFQAFDMSLDWEADN